MPALLDILLVLLAILFAVGYLVVRKIRHARHLARDWTTGRADSCSHCPVITIRTMSDKNKIS